MKKQFEHLLPLSEAEVDAIWNDGVLTVDTSVLLDLYRLHPESRDKLLEAIRSFGDRVWLSHQAGREFLTNRHEVLKSIEDELRTAEKTVGDRSSDLLNALKACRPLPQAIEGEVKKRLDDLKAEVARQVEDVRRQRASEGAEDAVLAAVISIFDGRTADGPSPNDLEAAHKEAARRIEKQIPPGFRDAKKDDEKSHGDYLIWREVLNYAKTAGKPVVLVTSERKDDWWEIRAGKTIGPRVELLEEARRLAGQRVLVHHTDSFIKRAADRNGQILSKAVVADLRAWTGTPSTSTTASPDGSGRDLEDIVYNLVDDLGYELVNDDPVSSLIAMTNASGWGVDSVEVLDVGPFDLATCTAPFSASVKLAGEQDEDHAWCGTSITAQVEGVVAFDGDKWSMQQMQVTEAEIDDFGGDSDYDDAEPDGDTYDTNTDGDE